MFKIPEQHAHAHTHTERNATFVITGLRNNCYQLAPALRWKLKGGLQNPGPQGLASAR